MIFWDIATAGRKGVKGRFRYSCPTASTYMAVLQDKNVKGAEYDDYMDLTATTTATLCAMYSLPEIHE